jgi:glycosyltransferase involved in cell wall biosynthesis
MRLALGLGERGWEASIAGPESASIYAPLEPTGISITRLPFRAGNHHPLADAQVLRELIGLTRRERFDLVYARSEKAGVLGRLASLAAGIPAVVNPGGFAFDPAVRRGPGRLFSLGLEHLLSPHTDAYVCVSAYERSVAVRHRVARPDVLKVIHNAAAECDPTVEADPALERFSEEGPLAACITVLRPEKGVDLFLDAAPYVFERLPEARLAVIGNGKLRATLEHQARTLGLDARLRFFDYRAPSSRWLRSVDIFVMPSRYEAFGIALAEAMACGVPQITTGVGGTTEVVRDGETGLVCRPNDPAHLADRIVRLLGDSELRDRMSAASRERHHRCFTLDRMLDETAAVFDRASAAGARR